MSKSVRGAASVRLRRQLERSVSSSVRSCADVAREYGVSDWSAHQALAVAGQVPPPVTRLGLDETRTRRVRWYRDGCGGWCRTNPWMTSFVDLDTGHPGWLLGLVPGVPALWCRRGWPRNRSPGATVSRS